MHVVGIGCLTRFGQGMDALWNGLMQVPDAPGFSSCMNGVPGKAMRRAYGIDEALIDEAWAPEEGGSITGNMVHVSRFERMMEVALKAAWLDAITRISDPASVRLGVVLGTGAGDTTISEQRWLRDLPAVFPACNPYMALEHVLERTAFRAEGPAFVVADACSSSLVALCMAASLIRRNEADAMIVLGVEVLSRVTQASFERMTALARNRCLPFGSGRDGTILGEAAVACVLVHDRVNGQYGSHASVLGWAKSCDAFHPTGPRPDGADIRKAMYGALHDAGIRREDLTLVVPHGTGTPQNDQVEGDLLAELTIAPQPGPAIMPIKSHLGHCAGASGLASLVAGVRALQEGRVPPVFHAIDRERFASLNLPGDMPLSLPEERPAFGLVNAYAFGGANVSVVIEGGRS